MKIGVSSLYVFVLKYHLYYETLYNKDDNIHKSEMEGQKNINNCRVSELNKQNSVFNRSDESDNSNIQINVVKKVKSFIWTYVFLVTIIELLRFINIT